jgi:quaternary ammonium compound-resistance protein SugE
MAWLTLLAAGALEIAFAASLKPSDGFTRLWPSLAVVVFGTAAVVTLTRALTTIPVGTAYAVFTGIGAVGTAAIGILVFHEPASLARLLCIGLVLTGVVGLRFVTPTG